MKTVFFVLFSVLQLFISEVVFSQVFVPTSFYKVKSGQTIWSWGYNFSGELGLGYYSRTAPYYVNSINKIGTEKKWDKIFTGQAIAAAIKKDGTLWTWGENGYGQLGLGFTSTYGGSPDNPFAPTQVAGLWSSVGLSTLSSANYMLGIKKDGTLWSWGFNAGGLLGLGTSDITKTHISPAQINPGTTWTEVSVGMEHSMAIKSDGTLWAWGNNAYGQLGLGFSGTDVLSPTQVGTAVNWKSISLGRYHSIGLKTDGTVWAWGGYEFGALGLGPAAVNISTPTQVGTDTDWKQISCHGSEHTMAIKTNGTLWAWGYNSSHGQLGLGDSIDRFFPTQVGAATNWKVVSATDFANSHTMAIKTDGTLWAWGSGGGNELGFGSLTYYKVPTQVGTEKGWKDVSAGVIFGLAIKNN